MLDDATLLRIVFGVSASKSATRSSVFNTPLTLGWGWGWGDVNVHLKLHTHVMLRWVWGGVGVGVMLTFI